MLASDPAPVSRVANASKALRIRIAIGKELQECLCIRLSPTREQAIEPHFGEFFVTFSHQEVVSINLELRQNGAGDVFQPVRIHFVPLPPRDFSRHLQSHGHGVDGVVLLINKFPGATLTQPLDQGGLQIDARHHVAGFGPSPCLGADTSGDPVELVNPRELSLHGIASRCRLREDARFHECFVGLRQVAVGQPKGGTIAGGQDGFEQVGIGFCPVANLGPTFHARPHRAHVERRTDLHRSLGGIEDGAEHFTPTLDVVRALCGTGGVQFTDQVVNVIRHRVSDGGDGGQDDSKQFRHPRAPVARSKRAFTAKEPC